VQTPEYSSLAREGAVKLTGLLTTTPDGIGIARSGDPLVTTLRYEARRPMQVRFELSYYSEDGKTLIATTSTPPGDRAITVDPAGGEIEFICQVLPFAPGNYYVSAVARDAASGHVVDWWDGGSLLRVDGGADVRGQFYVPHVWRAHVRHTPARVN
jgi:hypothetical protein